MLGFLFNAIPFCSNSVIVFIDMRLPTRRSERLKSTVVDTQPFYLTQEGLEKLQKKLLRIETSELPQAIEDVRITAEFGDFSENAEYQEAKARMRRLHNQVIVLKDNIQRAMIIQPNETLNTTIQIGSWVELEKDGVLKNFQIVGPQESDPMHGRISHMSPLGSSLIGHTIGETVSGYLVKDAHL